jgi:hypothetical protein
MAVANYVEFLFDLPCQLFYWHIAQKGWRGGKKGTMYIIPYDNSEKSQLVFMPLEAEMTVMRYVSDLAEVNGGLRANIHRALSVERHLDDTCSIVFGKAPSRSYTNSKGRAIKTAWVARFKVYWGANNFAFVLNRLIEQGGNVNAFNEENNVDPLAHFFENPGEEELEELKDNEVDSDDESYYRDTGEDAGGNGGEGYPDYDEDSDEQDRGDEQDSDEQKDVVGEMDEETALRIAHRLAPPDANSDDEWDEEDEVAQSQPLF